MSARPSGHPSDDPPAIHVADLSDLDAALAGAVDHRDARAVVRILRDLRAARPATWMDEARRVRASVDERAGSFLMSHVAACIFFEEADDDLAIEAIQEGERRAREVER